MHRAAILAALGGVLLAGAAEARTLRTWTYTHLMKAADLVVIATPRATTATGRLEELPDIRESDACGNASTVKAERLETELEVTVTLRGNPVTNIVLHHTREHPVGKPQLDGPGFVRFDPKDELQYLMFLVREPDGRYAAVSGQTDPNQAIEPLQHRRSPPESANGSR
jgi:hypothetical protein